MGSRRRIHTRDDLLEYLSIFVTRRCIVRALDHEVKLLGGFSAIPPSGKPGWIVRAYSPIGQSHYDVAVTISDGGTYKLWNLQVKVPWECWVGDGEETCLHSDIMIGDDPDMCVAMKQQAIETREELTQDVSERLTTNTTEKETGSEESVQETNKR
jgi:hypothetical protein